MMRTALQWGVKHRHIKENVADFADKPAHVRYQGAEPYTIQEIASLLSCTQNEPITPIEPTYTFYSEKDDAILSKTETEIIQEEYEKQQKGKN